MALASFVMYNCDQRASRPQLAGRYVSAQVARAVSRVVRRVRRVVNVGRLEGRRRRVR